MLLNLALLNVINSRHYTRFDWTSSRGLPVAQTQNVLAGLTRPVKITLFMVPPLERGSDRSTRRPWSLLDPLLGRSPMVTLERVDPTPAPRAPSC